MLCTSLSKTPTELSEALSFGGCTTKELGSTERKLASIDAVGAYRGNFFHLAGSSSSDIRFTGTLSKEG
jgi:hypothetical protein